MVSVCMATYNGERFIREQIDSILCQLKFEDELIISDDGSTDKTIEIINSYNDNRIILLHHKKNPAIARKKHSRNFYYASENFENALNHAHGDYVFLSDQDDVWLPGKVEEVCRALYNTDLVLHNLELSYENGFHKPCYDENPLPKNWLANLMAKPMPFWGCCLAFKKNLLEYILPFPRKLVAHDYWISCMALKHGKVTYVDNVLLNHRMYDESVSYGTQNPSWYKLWYRLKMIMQFIHR